MRQNIKASLNWSTVDVGQPHFLISHGEDYTPIAILQASEELEINLLADIDEEVLYLLEKELTYYLFEKQEDNHNRLNYLEYHCNSYSNAISKIHFSYISEITADLMVYFFQSENALCNLVNIDLINRAKNHYNDVLPINLFDADQLKLYDKTLRELASIIFEEIPSSYNLNIPDKPSFEDFRNKWLKGISLEDYISIITFLNTCDYIELDEEDYVLKYLIQVYYTIQQLS